METQSEAPWNVETLRICGGDVSFKSAGAGPAVVVLPRDNGHPPRHEFLDRLAEDYQVFVPFLPGFHGGHPEQWEAVENVRDLAVVLLQLVRSLDRRRIQIVGLGFGGWLAAELATMGAPGLERLALVAPMGIQPEAGFIYDQFLGSTEAYARAAFANAKRFEATYGETPEFEQLEGWETDREMTSRVAWKPYMYNPTLARLLACVAAPTLLVWGDGDAIVPIECGERYLKALPDAAFHTIRDAGHAVDLEQPAALAALVGAFFAAKPLAQHRG